MIEECERFNGKLKQTLTYQSFIENILQQQIVPAERNFCKWIKHRIGLLGFQTEPNGTPVGWIGKSKPETLEAMTDTKIEEWNNLPQEKIRT